MLARISAWVKAKLKESRVNDQIRYAARQYTLAVTIGDKRRAMRLREIIEELEETGEPFP